MCNLCEKSNFSDSSVENLHRIAGEPSEKEPEAGVLVCIYILEKYA